MLNGIKPKFITLCLLLGLLSAAGAEKGVRVALLSDPHVNFKTNGLAATFGAHFDQTIKAVNDARVDVVLIAGDLANEGTVEEWRAFRGYIKKLKAPVFYVPGNHDVGHKVNSGKKAGAVTSERVKSYEKELGKSWFANESAGLRIIGVNSSLLGSGLPEEEKQWTFLEKELSKPSPKPTILFMHYPLYLLNPEEAGGIYYNLEPAPRKRLLELLQRGGVKTVLTGHLHHNLVNRWQDMLFLSTEPISFGLPSGRQREGWTLVTIPKAGEATFETRNLDPP